MTITNKIMTIDFRAEYAYGPDPEIDTRIAVFTGNAQIEAFKKLKKLVLTLENPDRADDNAPEVLKLDVTGDTFPYRSVEIYCGQSGYYPFYNKELGKLARNKKFKTWVKQLKKQILIEAAK